MEKKTSPADVKCKAVVERFQRESAREATCQKEGVSRSQMTRWRQHVQRKVLVGFLTNAIQLRRPSARATSREKRLMIAKRSWEKEPCQTRSAKTCRGSWETNTGSRSVELAHHVSRPHGPDNKSPVARALEGGRATRSWPSKHAVKDTHVAVAIEKWHEIDETLGHRTLAALRETSPNRGRRILHTDGISARLKRRTDVSPGKASQIAPHLVRERDPERLTEVVFSNRFESKLADTTQVRDCFPLWKRTRYILGLAFASQLRAELVTAALQTLHVAVPEAMFHRDEGKPCGAQATGQFLWEKGFPRSMSRAGTPTDHGSAERFVGTFKLAGVERCRSETLGEFLRAAPWLVNVSQTLRPHEGLDSLSPEHYARERELPDVPPIPLW